MIEILQLEKLKPKNRIVMKLLQIRFTKFYHCWVDQVWNQEGTFYGSLGNRKRFNVTKR